MIKKDYFLLEELYSKFKGYFTAEEAKRHQDEFYDLTKAGYLELNAMCKPYRWLVTYKGLEAMEDYKRLLDAEKRASNAEKRAKRAEWISLLAIGISIIGLVGNWLIIKI